MKQTKRSAKKTGKKSSKVTGIQFERLEDRVLYSATPTVHLDVPDDVRVGEDIEVKVSFENSAANVPGNTGYGPWIDVAIDATGQDGAGPEVDDGNPATTNPGTDDGFTITDTPNYLGANLNHTILTLDDTANGGKGVMHPYAKDTAGNPIFVSTSDITSPYFANLNGSFQSGDKLLVIELPFGSYTPDQPDAEVTFGLHVSNLADIGAPLPIKALGGFRYGNDPLDNPNVDPSIIGVATADAATVSASLAKLTKEYIGPENETATGPNYLRTYRIDVDIANGQTLSNLNIYDALPDQVQYVGISGSSHGYSTISAPGTSTPGGDVHIVFNTAITGTSSATDAWIEVQFYVPRLDATGAVINPAASGDDFLIDNQAYGHGNWNPVDTRDADVRIGLEATVDPDIGDTANPIPSAEPEHEDLEAQSIAIQKEFENLTRPGAEANEIRPGDLLEYTLEFQISDYFAFQNINIDDLLGDGLRIDASYTPVLSINGNTYTLASLAFDPSNWSYTVNTDNNLGTPATDGSTALHFSVSGELIDRASSITAVTSAQIADKNFALAGKLLGGGVNPLNPDPNIANDLAAYNAGATTGTITYRVIVQDKFTDTAPSGEASLNPRDELSNTVDIEGDVLDLSAPSNALPATGLSEADDSGVTLQIEEDIVQKSIYAINGSTNLSAYQDPSGTINLQPGDVITYRIRYTIPSGDIEDLRFTDYLPLPVFDVTDPDGDGVASGWTFVTTGGVPTTGQATYGPDHTLDDATTPPPAMVTLTIDAESNSLRFEIGDAINTANNTLQVDILFSVTVGTDPFADGLYLTNQVQSGEQNTQNPGVENEATTNAIVQIVLNEPNVNIYKGVVASTQGPSVGTVGGVSFDDIGAGGNDFSGTLSGAGNAAAIGALDLVTSTLPDAGDLVRFAIVAQNTGRSDAFDVRLTDTVRGSYVNNYANASAFVAATNFRVLRGDGTTLTLGTDYTLTWNNTTKQFEVELTDNYISGNTSPGDTKSGGLSRGFDAATASDVTNGSNSIVVLYDLTLDTDAQTGSTINNTVTLTNYAGSNSGGDHTAIDKTESASVRVDTPEFTKALVGTEINATGNGNTEAVIGELVTYTLTITVPEGTTVNSQLIDRLDPGMAFVQITSVSVSAGVSAAGMPGMGTNPANVAVGNTGGGTGNQLTFNLGAITNTNAANGTVETITITYQAVVLNTNTVPSSPGNQAGTTLDNSANFSYGWTNDGVTTPATGSDSILRDAADITLVEPRVSVEKAISRDNATYNNTSLSDFDAGDSVFYRITLTTAANSPTAFDISLSDQLPAVLAGATIVSVTGGGLTAGNFSISGGNLLTLATSGVDLPAGTTVTIVVQGSLATSLSPSVAINNDAVVKWSSMDGTVTDRSIHNSASDERDGSGANPTGNTDSSATDTTLNNYAGSNRAVLNTSGYGTDKSIVSTSVVSSTGTDLVVGEVVRYRIVTWLPEGTSNNLQIEENLPAGLIFLNNGNARYAFVSSTAGNITSTSVSGYSTVTSIAPGANTIVASPTTGAGYNAFIAGVTSASLTGTFADNNIGDTAAGAGTGEIYSDGENVFFRLGNVVNSESDADREMVIIEFDAYVANVVSNQDGVTLNNNIRVLADSTGDGTPGYKSLDNNRDGDRGDTGETSTDADDDWSTTAGQTAANSTNVSVVVQEPVLAINKTITTAPIDAGDPITYQIVITNNSGQTAYEVTLNDAIDPNINVTAGLISATPAGGATVSAGAFEIVEVTPGVFALRTAAGADIDIPDGGSVTLSFTGTVDASVAPGTIINNQADAQWSSLPAGLDGDDAGTLQERTGSDGSGSPNDYEVSSSVATQVLNNIDIDKSIVTTSLGGADGVVTPGEIVTYMISVTLPEGVSPNLRIRDAIPTGMALVPGSIVLNTTGYNGTVSTPTHSPQSGVQYLNGTDIEFNFSSITTTNDNNVANNTFTFTYQAVVLDVGDRSPDGEANDGQGATTTTLTNTATHNNGSGSTFGDAESVSVDVVEPDLNVANSLNITGPQDAGAPFTYTITVTPTANANSGAYEVNISELLPAELGSLSIASAIVSDGATSSNVAGNFSLSGNTLSTLTPLSLLLNTNGSNDQTLTITITGTLTSAINPGETVNTSTSLDYTNYPGDLTSAGGFNPNPDVSTDHERTYTDSDTESFTTPNATISKSLFSGDSNVAIGETVTYALLVTLPEGTTPDLSIMDRLPAGLQYVSSSVVTTAAASGGLLSADFNGTVSAPTISGGAGNGADVGFTFGSISVTGDNLASTNSFVILVTARATNTVANQGGTALSNDATLDISTDNAPVVTTPNVDITVVEPDLQIDKSIVGSTANVEAGDTVTYQIQVNHSGSSAADAYDLNLSDDMTAHFGSSVTLVSAFIGATDVTSLFAINGSGDLITTGNVDLLQGETLTILVSGVVRDATVPGTVLANAATVTWTSLNGTDANERDGDGGVDDYSRTDLAPSIVTVGALNVTKVADKSQATIGDIVTYTVSVTVGEGTTNNLLLNDTLPPGMEFVANSASIVSNPAGMTISGFNGNSLDQTLSVVNPGNVDNAATLDTDTFQITYQVRVLDVAGNTAGTALVNDLDVSADNVPPDNDNTATVTVIEPALQVTKLSNDADGVVSVGQLVTYTLTVTNPNTASGTTAYDVVIRDAVPANLSLVPGSITIAGGVGPVDNSSGNDLSIAMDSLAEGQSIIITFQAYVLSTAAPGAPIDNTVKIYYDTQPADDGNNVLNPGTDATEDRDYGSNPTNEVHNANTDPHQDTERVTVGTATVGNFVWNDLDADGVQDATEPGIGGVRVYIDLDGDGTFDSTEATAITDANGGYTITGLAAGTYNVRVDTSTLPAAVTQTFDLNGALDNAGVATLSAGQNRTDVDFGYVGSASISNRLWSDFDGNGTQNGLEPGVAGATVNLYRDLNGDGDAADAGEGLIRTRVTNANGDYNFSGLIGGNYFVEVNTATAGLAGATVTFDKDDYSTVATNNRAYVSLGSTENDSGVDFGFRGTGSIGDLVWNDLDGDGARDAGEPGIAGVTIDLILDLNGNGLIDAGDNVVQTLTTGANGAYDFTSLLGASYIVNVTDTGNVLASTTLTGASGVTDPEPVVLAAGQDYNDADFGYQGQASISNYIWFDLDGDAVQDASELGIAGVRVFVDLDNDGVFDSTEASAVTDANGQYLIDGLIGGTYTVRIEASTLPAGTIPTFDLDGIGTLNVATVALGATQDRTDVDFGYRGGTSLGDKVWMDLNSDGLLNGIEPGIPNVALNLYWDANNNGTLDAFESATPYATTTTDLEGNYTFSNLIGGRYFVQVNTSTIVTGATPTYDLNGVGTPSITDVVLTAGEDRTDVDFGYNGAGSIGDLVWNDLDADGVRDVGEPGLGNVTIDLYIDKNGNGVIDGTDAVMATTTTATDGTYGFTGLVGGNYLVQVTDLNNVLASANPTYDLDGLGTPGLAAVSLTPTQNRTDVDFGYQGQAAIGNFVWNDLDSDGVQDALEPGIGGVRVWLDLNNNGSADTYEPFAITDATGAYNITGLVAGTYRVRVDASTLPASVTQTYDQDGLGTANQAVTTLGATETDNSLDFGYVGGAALGNRVWNDYNADGVQDAREPGVVGVTINLYRDLNSDGDYSDSGEGLIAQTITGVDGAYSFTGLIGGGYIVEITDTANLLNGATSTFDKDDYGTVADNGTSFVSLSATETDNGVDFGYVGNISIGDRVWFDVDGDGVQDNTAGVLVEPGIPGATVYIDLDGDNTFDANEPFRVTDNDGLYSFGGLIEGTYTVRVITSTLPGGATQTFDRDGTGTANSATLTVVSGDNITDVDYGYRGTASIGDRVWLDIDGDGVQDGSEPGIVGVTVDLFRDLNSDGDYADAGEGFIQRVTTGADGIYNFTDLLAGGYVVQVTDVASVLAGSDPTYDLDGIGTANVAAATVTAGQIRTDVDFGYQGQASVAGTVFDDRDNDGVQDVGENGIAGASVSLSGTDVLGNTVNLTLTTDAAGNYVFDNLWTSNGTGYTLTEVTPAGYLDGIDAAGTISASTVGTAGNDIITGIILPPGAAGITYTFGELVPSSLAGKVYVDQSADGAYDVGEPGISGVTVTLTGTDDRGNAISVIATTDVNGDYSFTNLRPGTYTVTETQPAGLQDGGDSVGTLGGTVGNDVISNIAVSPAQDGTGYNFGEGTTSISGTVYQDADTDATLDMGEAGLSGVTIELYDSGNVLIATTVTDVNGNYSFTGLIAGNYTVVETQPTGYGSSDTNTRPVTLPVTGLAGVNFGETRGSIAGAVYYDADGDGTRDVGEVGIGGVTVNLTGTDDVGNAVNLTVTTGADGTYRFDNLLGGTYELAETQPGTYIDGEETVGSDGGTIVGPDSITSIVLVPAAAPQTAPAFSATGYLFGEQLDLAPGTGAITGTVYHDEDVDGVLDSGETGIAGVTIRLRDNLGNLVSTTTSDASGNYAFLDLAPGNYTVEEIQPVAYGSSTPNSLTPVLVVTGAVTNNQNFGETDGSIAGSVYVDTDNDGIRDGGENGIAGVTVTLTGTDFYGNAVNQTVTTDLDGNYLFDDLLGGNYTIIETQPAGINDGTDSIGTSGGVLGNDVLSNIGLGGGINATDYNFGERPSTISGTVFLDNDRDGAVDPAEDGIAGVVVSLVDSDGNTVATTTTDANGYYEFTGVGPGNYTIVETQPTGYGSSPAGPFSPNTRPITLGTADVTNQNFGETVSSIAGRVYIDENNNGADDGETGIAGVIVTLTGTDAQGNAVSITTTSASDGTYVFTNLLAGTYNLTETQPGAYADAEESVGTAGGATNPPNDAFFGVGLGAGIDATGYNFGERVTTPPGTGAILGNVYLDRNLDANLTSGEPGIGGVTIELYDSGNALVGTTTTAADGSYSFTNLAPGTYEVRERQPTGYGTTTPNTIATIIVVADSVTTGVNFGESLGSISGNVFYDEDEGADRDPGEQAIAGVTITLTGVDANGTAVNRTTTTAADGTYRFDDLLSGNYTVTETQPVGWADGADIVGSEGGATTFNDVESGISLGVGVNGTGYDFAELGADISGTVYLDDNRDGDLDGGETGLGGIAIRLIDSNGTVVATTTTAADGTYEFQNVAPGDYTVQELQPGEYGSSSSNTIPVTVAGTDVNGLDFGETTGSIAGSVYVDADNDGIRDAGEVGIGGVQVDLTGTDINGNAVSFTTTTAADGTYSFTGLLTGTYVLTEPTQPAPFLDGGETAGTGGGNTTANETITDIGLGGGEQLAEYLFGERGEVDLVVGKESSGSFTPGQAITYTITVRNVGNQDATQVVVTDIFPTEALVFLTASNGGTIANGVITWDLGTISAVGAEVVTLTVTAQVRSSIPGGIETITNTVTAIDDGTNLPDPTPNNNTAVDVDPIIARPELEIDINDHVTRVEKGDKVTYVVTVRNTGNQDATNVTVDTIFPDEILKYIRDSLGNGTYTSRNGDDLITWEIGTVRAGETIQFTITAVVDREIDRNVTDITAIANVQDDGAGTNGKPLFDTDDDIDQPVFPSNIDLAVTITDHRRNVDPGEKLTYEVLAQNLSGADSHNVVVTVELPKDAVYVSSKHGGVYDPKTHTVTWTLDYLQAGDEKSLQLRVEVNENAGEGNFRLDAAIRDDGAAGEELTMTNNDDPDVDVIEFSEADETLNDYFFDSFNNYIPADEDEEFFGENPIPEGVLPILPLMPIYSGHAEPGATVEIELYNIKGALIGTDVIMADAGGNWLAKFPNNVIYDTPTNVVQKETKPTYAYTGESGFNLRTYFSPAINPSHFFNRALTVGSVFSETAGSRVEKIQDSSEGAIGVGEWEGFEYEFLAAPGTPSN